MWYLEAIAKLKKGVVIVWLFLVWLVLLMVFKTPLSTKSQLYCGDQFYWWRKPEYPEKTTDRLPTMG
jgi:hypothetical protein